MVELTLSIYANYPAGQAIPLAQAAERLGFPMVWIADEASHTADPWVLASALVTATDRIRVGPGVTNPYSRDPRITANALATLSDLAPGRTFIGLGAGGALGLPPIDTPRRPPVAAVRELIDLVRSRAPGVEVWIGAKGPRMLELAAREADGLRLTGIPLAGVEPVVAAVRRSAEAPFAIALSPTVVRDGNELERARLRLVHEFLGMPVAWRDFLDGPVPSTNEVQRRFDEGGPRAAAALFSDGFVDQFAVTGPDEAIVSALHRIVQRANLDQLVLPMGPPEGGEERLVRLARLRQDLATAR